MPQPTDDPLSLANYSADSPERLLQRYALRWTYRDRSGKQSVTSYLLATDDAAARATADEMIATWRNNGRGPYRDATMISLEADPLPPA